MDASNPPAEPDPEGEPPSPDAEPPPPAGPEPEPHEREAPDAPVPADATPNDPGFPIAEITPDDFAAPRPDAPAGDWQPADGELTERLARAERRTDELVAANKRQGALADQLHAANQVLRDGELRTALAPLVRGLARVADDLERIREQRADDADLEHVENRVHEVLHDAGVRLVSPQPGDPFDPAQHQARGTVPTGDAAQDRSVAKVVRTGLVQDDGRVLRPADVLVHRLKEASA